MLVKRESTSRLPIENSESCSTISSAKANEPFTVYSLLVKDFKTGTRSFAFFVHFEKNWLQNCPSGFKPCYYRRYVDDILVLFTSPQHLEAFQNFLNGRHANMSFTIESEKQNRMSYLDVQIIREDKTFSPSLP